MLYIIYDLCQIIGFRLRCKNASNGCKALLTLETVEAHEKTCVFEKCSNCGALPIININLKERVTYLEDQVTKLEKENKELYQLIYSNASQDIGQVVSESNIDDEHEIEREWNDMEEEVHIQDLEQQLIAYAQPYFKIVRIRK